MQSKRRAAADVFIEQQRVQQAEEPELAAPADQPAAQAQPALAMGWSPPAAPQLAAFADENVAERYARRQVAVEATLKTSEELQLEKEPIRVRETGFWLWRRVIVPPNAYVVHTRLGRKEPVTLGLGLSFRYNRYKDAYLVVPAAMQTIGIVANGISREKQGINILAYVQWQISDFAIAYRKLDFSDSRDPLAIVNAQLREQAEAAIKDKIATMSVEEILTDKAPIIEELTTRLKAVAEGRSQSDQTPGDGLGIKIVTVQIKEAYVSSQRLWQDLQAPYRYEQARISRVSYLQSQDQVRHKELETRQLAEIREAETLVEIERIKQGKQTEALDIRLSEEALRFTQEQTATRQKLELQEETTRLERESAQRLQLQAASIEQALKLDALRRTQAEQLERAQLDSAASQRQKTLEVDRGLQALAEEARLAEARLQTEREQLQRDTALKREEFNYQRLLQEQEAQLQRERLEEQLASRRQETLAGLELEQSAAQVRLALAERELAITRGQQEIRNLVNERDLSSRLIDKLPQLAEQMPEIHELKVLQMGDGDGAFSPLPAYLARLLAVAQSMGLTPASPAAQDQPQN